MFKFSRYSDYRNTHSLELYSFVRRESEIVLGRPLNFPAASAMATPSLCRSLMRLRSNSARAPMIVSIRLLELSGVD